jgi:hypothetical protein
VANALLHVSGFVLLFNPGYGTFNAKEYCRAGNYVLVFVGFVLCGLVGGEFFVYIWWISKFGM